MGRFAASANFTSEQDSRTILGAQLISRGDSIVVGRASFSVESSAWGATLFLDNVNNERGTPAAGAFARSRNGAPVCARERWVCSRYSFE